MIPRTFQLPSQERGHSLVSPERAGMLQRGTFLVRPDSASRNRPGPLREARSRPSWVPCSWALCVGGRPVTSEIQLDELDTLSLPHRSGPRHSHRSDAPKNPERIHPQLPTGFPWASAPQGRRVHSWFDLRTPARPQEAETWFSTRRLPTLSPACVGPLTRGHVAPPTHFSFLADPQALSCPRTVARAGPGGQCSFLPNLPSEPL